MLTIEKPSCVCRTAFHLSSERCGAALHAVFFLWNFRRYACDVVRALPLLLDADFKLHVVSLPKLVAKPRILHVTFMEENIFAFRRCQKTESFCRIEEFYGAIQHV